MDSFQLVPVDGQTDAILINTHQRSGGRKHSPYFVVSRNGKCDVITKPEIGDMVFIVDSIF